MHIFGALSNVRVENPARRSRMANEYADNMYKRLTAERRYLYRILRNERGTF